MIVSLVLRSTNSCVRESDRETFFIHGLNRPTNTIISVWASRLRLSHRETISHKSSWLRNVDFLPKMDYPRNFVVFSLFRWRQLLIRAFEYEMKSKGSLDIILLYQGSRVLFMLNSHLPCQGRESVWRRWCNIYVDIVRSLCLVSWRFNNFVWIGVRLSLIFL